MRKQNENKKQNQEIISAINVNIPQYVKKALAEMKESDRQEWVNVLNYANNKNTLAHLIASFKVMQKAGMTTAEGCYGKIKNIEVHPAYIALFVARLPQTEYCKRHFYSGQLFVVYAKEYNAVPHSYKYSREARYLNILVKANKIAEISAGIETLRTDESRPLSRWFLTKENKEIVADCVATGRAWSLQTLK